MGAYLRDVPASALTSEKTPRALIAPHAGYRYSGPAAAWAYASIDPSVVKRVFLLGPSHHVFLRECALTTCDVYRTPLGDLRVDDETYADLRSTGAFVEMTQSVDEEEHSLEMHLPYIYKVFSDPLGDSSQNTNRVIPSLVPVMVGALTGASEKKFGKILSRYLDDPANLFVVSTDFCHWGKRFRYTPFITNDGKGGADDTDGFEGARHVRVHERIERLDKEGMGHIESKDADAFLRYLEKTKNTICGRHPVSVFLRALEHSRGFAERTVKFVRYEQSCEVRSEEDSSVSYASAVVY